MVAARTEARHPPVRLLNRWLGNSALRAAGTLASATAVGQVLMLLTLPLLTRLYGPEAFGVNALLASFVGVASVGVCLSLELSIVSGKTADVADELFVAAIMSIPTTTVIACVLLAAMMMFDAFGFGKLPFWGLALAGVMIGVNGLYLAARYRTLREQDYQVLARATVVQASGRAFAPLALRLMTSSWAGLALGELLGRTLGTWRLLRPLWPRLRELMPHQSLGGWWHVVRRERRFTHWLLSLVVIDACASLLIAPLLAEAYGANAAGEYFLVSMVLVAPSALIGSAAADILHTRGAALLHGHPRHLPRLLYKAASGLLLAGCAVYLPVFALATPAFPWVFGGQWQRAAEVAEALTPFMIVAFVASPCARLLVAVNLPHLKVWSDLMRLAGTPAIIFWCQTHGVPFIGAMWRLSWFLAASYLLYFLITAYAVHQRAADR